MRGSCHCGAVEWRFTGLPESATVCNCTVCRRYGTLWAYGFEGEGIDVSGRTAEYVRGDSLGFHFCPACGCVAFWRSLKRDDAGRRRIGVNLRMAEPDAVAKVPIDRFDGLDGCRDLPRDGRCVRDYLF